MTRACFVTENCLRILNHIDLMVRHDSQPPLPMWVPDYAGQHHQGTFLPPPHSTSYLFPLGLYSMRS
jgi:hypothetical protein